MSELVTLTNGATATIYGTFAAAVSYIGSSYGDAYTAWLALSVDDQKRTLISAERFLDRQAWSADYVDFADRDAEAAFAIASYELAAMIAEDPAVTAAADAGTNVKQVYAGGAGVEYFSGSSASAGTASVLPPILAALLDSYLDDASAAAYLVGGVGAAGDCCDPFNDMADFDRDEPY